MRIRVAGISCKASNKADMLRAKVEEYLNSNIKQVIERIAIEYVRQLAAYNYVHTSLCTPERIAATLLRLRFSGINVEPQPGITITTKNYDDNLEPLSFKVSENKLYIYLSNDPPIWLEADYCDTSNVNKELKDKYDELYGEVLGAISKYMSTIAQSRIEFLEERLRAAQKRANQAEAIVNRLKNRCQYVLNELYGILEMLEEHEEKIPSIVIDKIRDLIEYLEEKESENQ